MKLTTADAAASQLAVMLADTLADSMSPATTPAVSPVLGRSKMKEQVLLKRGECRRRIEAIHDARELERQLEF